MAPRPSRDPEDVERLLAEAGDRLEDGDASAALERAEAALARAPRSVGALHLRAAALADLDRLDDARAAYDAALAAGPDDLDLLVGAADFLVSRAGDGESDPEALEAAIALARRGAKLARRAGDADLEAELALLEGMALSQLGASAQAIARFDAVLAHAPDDVDARAERGFALFELGRLDEARRQLTDLVRDAPDAAWAHHTLGLVAERAGDAAEAGRRFGRARKLDPEQFPRPVELSAAAFDAAVEDALRELPDPVRRYLAEVAIAVEDLPSDDDLRGDPPLSPAILGVFRGAPLGEKASMDPWSHFPSSIVLYQKNLQRFARDRRELIEQIRVTLLHEVGHFLGLDEQDLWERGLD